MYDMLRSVSFLSWVEVFDDLSKHTTKSLYENKLKQEELFVYSIEQHIWTLTRLHGET